MNISRAWRAVLIVCAMVVGFLLLVYISRSIAP